MALVPLRLSVSESFCTSISWHLQHGQGKKVTGGAYGRLSAGSADFSAVQQDTSAMVQITGTLRGDGTWGGFGLARRSL